VNQRVLQDRALTAGLVLMLAGCGAGSSTV